MTLQVRTHTNSVSDINMDSEKVEGLCFPLLLPHGEPGYTNTSKSGMSLDEYAMSRLIRPEKIGRAFMTAPAQYAPVECVDSCIQVKLLHLLRISLRLKSIRCKVPQFFLI